MAVWLFQYHLLGRLLFAPWNYLGTLIENQWPVNVSLFLNSEFCSLNLCVCPDASNTLSWLLQLCKKFDIDEVNSSVIFLFLDGLGLKECGLLNFRITWSVFVGKKRQLGYLEVLCWNHEFISEVWLS